MNAISGPVDIATDSDPMQVACHHFQESSHSARGVVELFPLLHHEADDPIVSKV